ncbi:MAG: hypothetical protein FMNOHCHN_00396 [Ignavibacteriaceae bacterium]|nr:hypothetical protein [Ignavibacteriaceae bacterium]
MNTLFKNHATLLAVFFFVFAIQGYIFPHCDAVDGPVVKAAKKALATGNVNHVLIWVRAEDEKEIKDLFKRVQSVSKLNDEASELARDYFYETVVRVHRMGEGVGYTGLQPEGYQPEPGIVAADEALEHKSVETILHHTGEKHHAHVKELFTEVVSKSSFPADDLKAGREYVAKYVTFIHYIESLYKGEAPKTDEHHHH